MWVKGLSLQALAVTKFHSMHGNFPNGHQDTSNLETCCRGPSGIPVCRVSHTATSLKYGYGLGLYKDARS